MVADGTVKILGFAVGDRIDRELWELGNCVRYVVLAVSVVPHIITACTKFGVGNCQ